MKAVLISVLILSSNVVSQRLSVSPYAGLNTKSGKTLLNVSFSADGKLLAAGDEKGKISCWNVGARQFVTELEMRDDVLFLGFLSQSNLLAGVDKKGHVYVFDINTGTVQSELKTSDRPMVACLDAGRQYLAVATKDEVIEIFDLKVGMLYGVITGKGKLKNALFLGFDRRGEQLIAIGERANVAVWSPSTQKLIREVTLHGGQLYGSNSAIMSAATNRAANLFVVGLQEVAIPKGGLRAGGNLMRENSIIAYDWQTGIEVKRFKTDMRIDEIALGPGNDHVAIYNDRSSDIMIIDLRKGELRQTVTGSGETTSLAISPDDKWLAAGSDKGTITIWKMEFIDNQTISSSTGLASLGGRIRVSGEKKPALSSGEKRKVAVLKVLANSVDPNIAQICLTTMSNQLANVNYLTLIERQEIEQVLKEQDFQMSDLTEDQGVEVGKLLNADVVIIGSVGKLGSIFVFNARLLDVETGQILKGREVICEECRDQDLYDAMRLLSSTIAN